MCFFKSTITASNVEQIVLPCGQHKADMRKCVRHLHCIPSFQYSCDFVHLGLWVWVFLEQLTGGLLYLGRSLPWLFQKSCCADGADSLSGWENENKVKGGYSKPEHFSAHIRKITLWSLPKYTTGTPTLQLHCQQNVNAFTVWQTGSDLMKDAGLHVGCPVPFQNCCGAGAGAHL